MGESMALGTKKKPTAPEFRIKPHIREVFDEIAPTLSTREFRPLNQRYWAQRLGMLQQRVSQIFASLVTDEILVSGPADGNLRTYKLNKKHSFIQETMAKAG